VHVLRASFDWDDIGTWTSLQRLLGRNSAGNVIYGDGALLKSEDCIIYSMDQKPGSVADPGEAPPRPRLVVGYNLKGMVLVSTPDAVLVLPAEDVQRVKDVVAYLREKGLTSFL